MIYYKLVHGKTIDAFEAHVNVALQEGYTFYGEIVILREKVTSGGISTRTQFFQAMIKHMRGSEDDEKAETEQVEG